MPSPLNLVEIERDWKVRPANQQARMPALQDSKASGGSSEFQFKVFAKQVN
jgi:hypothetical protein